jgi:hypothetical protein
MACVTNTEKYYLQNIFGSYEQTLSNGKKIYGATGTTDSPSGISIGTSSGSTITTNPCGEIWVNDTSANTILNTTININKDYIMQTKVAVFKVKRDKDNKITETEFIKELWVESKNGTSVDFQVARDKDLAEYESSDLVIKQIHTVTF